MKDLNGNWLRLDRLSNTINNLEMVTLFLDELDDPIRWKWAVIALHQALYGFAICATMPSDSSFSLKDPEDPSSQLIPIWKALKRSEDPDWIPRTDWAPLTISDEENYALEKIISEFRNGFAHFKPGGWSIEVSGMPSLFLHIMRIIDHLALRSNNILYINEELQTKVEQLINKTNSVLRELSSA